MTVVLALFAHGNLDIVLRASGIWHPLFGVCLVRGVQEYWASLDDFKRIFYEPLVSAVICSVSVSPEECRNIGLVREMTLGTVPYLVQMLGSIVDTRLCGSLRSSS